MQTDEGEKLILKKKNKNKKKTSFSTFDSVNRERREPRAVNPGREHKHKKAKKQTPGQTPLSNFNS